MNAWRSSWARWLVPGWLLVAILALCSGVFAAPPVPPAPTSYVTDEAKVLSADTRESLDRRLARYEQDSGHQVIVWIGRTAGDVPIEEFAVEAFEQWKIGRPGLDDGLGVFVATEDRTIRVEVGYGLEPTITDLIASRVIRTVMIPQIVRGDWDAAIVTGLETLVDTIEGAAGSLPADPEGPEEPAAEAGGHKWSGWGLGAMILGIVVFMILFATNPGLALGLLFMVGHGGLHGGSREDGGGFGGLGGRSGGGGATGRW